MLDCELVACDTAGKGWSIVAGSVDWKEVTSKCCHCCCNKRFAYCVMFIIVCCR